MNKFLMKLMLLIIAGIIYLLTGRNRRQKEKIRMEWTSCVIHRNRDIWYMQWESLVFLVSW